MTCPDCKQPVEDAALFCGNCGFHLRETVAAAAVPVAAVTPVPALAVQPAAPAAAPVQQAVPAPAVPTPPAAPATPVAPVSPAPAQPIPGYAVPQASAGQKGTLELVFGILSIPAALIPLLGFGFGIAALVVGKKHAAGGKWTAPMVLGLIGIVLSSVVFVFNVVSHVQHSETSGGTGLVRSILGNT